MGVSLNPKDAVKGGLITDVDGVISEIKFEKNFTYPNGTPGGCAAVAKLKLEGGDETDVFWSVGKSEDYEVSSDGYALESAKGHTGVGDNSNFIGFTSELINAGFPQDKLGERLDVLIGLKAHWIQKAQPKRAGLASAGGERERTYLVPEKILQLPWDKNGGGAGTKSKKGAGAANSTAAAAAAAKGASADAANDLENEDATGLAGAALFMLKEAKPGAKIPKYEWQARTLTMLQKVEGFADADAAVKTAATRLVKNVEFLTGNDITIDSAGAYQLPSA